MRSRAETLARQARHDDPGRRARAADDILAALREETTTAPDRVLLLRGLLELFGDESERVFAHALAAAAARPEFVDHGGGYEVVAGLSTLGADGANPQANGALRALKAVERRLEASGWRDPLK